MTGCKHVQSPDLPSGRRQAATATGSPEPRPTRESRDPIISAPFSDLDRAAVGRALSQVADRPDDLADAYFEQIEEVALPPDETRGRSGGLTVRREEGFAVRLVRGDRTWLASRDGIEPREFAAALRQIARVLPSAAYPEPRLPATPPRGHGEAPEILDLPARVARAVREHHVAFPLQLTVRRHRRNVQVVGLGPVADSQTESWYSLDARFSWGRWGTLLPELGDDAVQRVAAALVSAFRARHATPPQDAARHRDVILGPSAAAVFLHEAVAHALEADVLAQGGGRPEAACGVEMAPRRVSVLDDPAAAPEPVRRTFDDEGMAVSRRWLLRDGVVSQPLADSRWAAHSDALLPGAGRRGHRHVAPGPRSTHLEMLPGEATSADLLRDAENGLYLSEASRGRLDVDTGVFHLDFPFGRRIREGVAADPVGPCRLIGRVAELTSRIAAVGDRPEAGGAGWCAKGGSKLPVWATVPAIRLEGVTVQALPVTTGAGNGR